VAVLSGANAQSSSVMNLRAAGESIPECVLEVLADRNSTESVRNKLASVGAACPFLAETP
jgi:hypothetical protein